MSTPRSRAAVRDSAARWTPVELALQAKALKLWEAAKLPLAILAMIAFILIGSINDFPLSF